MDEQAPVDARIPFELSGRQRDLADALAEKEPRLGAMYLGALAALDGSGNHDAIPQACHSMRELMEKLPLWYAKVPAPEQLPRMGDKVRALSEVWEETRENSKSLNGGSWCGPIDRYLEVLLRKVEEFFAWLTTDMPTRKQRTARMLRALDPQQMPLPATMEKKMVDEWTECRVFFVDVAHHKITATHEEVRRIASLVENLLLDMMRPRPFEKHGDIDAILEEGERDANP